MVVQKLNFYTVPNRSLNQDLKWQRSRLSYASIMPEGVAIQNPFDPPEGQLQKHPFSFSGVVSARMEQDVIGLARLFQRIFPPRSNNPIAGIQRHGVH